LEIVFKEGEAKREKLRKKPSEMMSYLLLDKKRGVIKTQKKTKKSIIL